MYFPGINERNSYIIGVVINIDLSGYTVVPLKVYSYRIARTTPNASDRYLMMIVEAKPCWYPQKR